MPATGGAGRSSRRLAPSLRSRCPRMSKTFLAWCGLLTLIALCAASVGGLLLVKDRVRVVVQPDGSSDEDARQLAELRDELTRVQRDVQALATALGSGLERLADDGTADRTARLEEMRAHVDRSFESLHARLATLEQIEHDGEQRVEEAFARCTGLLHARSAEPASDEPTAVAAQPGEAHAEHAPRTAEAGPLAPAAAPPVPVPAPSVSPPAAATTTAQAATPPRRRSSFAFELPSQTFRFDLEQRFELLPSLSRVGFDAKSTLHDFTGVTSRLAGWVRLDLSAPGPCSGEIRVDARALDTGLPSRNTAMGEHLAIAEHPEIVFAFTGLTADEVDRQAQTVRGTAHGTMTIRGRSQAVAMPVRLRVDESKRVHAEGEMMLALTDYGIPVPSQLGLISMQEQVKVWIALQARALGEGQQ